jgi:acetyltransferase-like isoleucine patch superfamily enzyme
MGSEAKIIKGGVRKYQSKSLVQIIRNRFMSSRVAGAPQNLFVEKSVQFLRHPKNIHLSNNIIIKEGSKLCSTNKDAIIKIGENTTIGYYSMLFSSLSIDIGDNCLIAPFAYFVDANHGIKGNKLINQQDLEAKPIKIHNDVWIGANVTVIGGIEIGEGSVIASQSLVNKNIPPYSVYGGIPAKFIKDRE